MGSKEQSRDEAAESEQIMTVVADTNVAVVANGQSPQASEDCVEICIDRLMQIVRGEVRLALDDQRRIIEEYRRNLSPGEQRGVGNAFITWVEQNWANSQRCDLVPITPINNLENEFQEFPTDPDLQNFDPDDRKFIAVALAHPEKPPILQAVDYRWLDFHDAFQRNGLTVAFICREDIQP